MSQAQRATAMVAAPDHDAEVASMPSPSLPTGLRFQPTSQLRLLKDEVEDLVRPWRRNKHKPPFTTGELIVIVLVLSDLKPHMLKMIHHRILSTFAYYTRQALFAYTDQLDAEASDLFDSSYEEKPDLDHVLPDLYKLVREFELPLNWLWELDPYDDTDICEQVFTIRAQAARIYLRDKLEPPRQGTFDLMGLPAEIREKIFKMLLVYPKPGLTLADNVREPDRRETRLGLWSRTDLDMPEYSEGMEIPENEFAVESLTKTLAILRVSKQIRHEALPVFYGRNAFNFGSLRTLDRGLELLSQETLRQIQEIRIVLHRGGESYAGLQLHSLANLRALEAPKKLTLTVPRNSAFWRRFCGFVVEDRAATPIELSSVDDAEELVEIIALAKRAKHVEFRGDGFLGDYIRQKIGQPKETQ